MPSYYEQIYGWFDWPNLYKSMVEKFHHGGHFVEIGCYKGRSGMYLAELILENDAKIKVDYIDPWSWKNPHVAEDSEYTPEDIYNIFMGNFNSVTKGDSRFSVKRNRSQLEATNYYDGSLDFVFVDGGHEPEEVFQDIMLYLPKIRPGGTIAGHDVSGEDVQKGLQKAREAGFAWANEPPNCWRYDLL